MRKIKFRAWDTISKKMTYGPTADNPSSICKVLLPMQYTGLRDKNGKEIYEGDILNDSNLPGVIEKQGVVEWNAEGYWHFKFIFDLDWGFKISKREPEFLSRVLSDLKIIGNKYETPELLYLTQVMKGWAPGTLDLLENKQEDEQ